MAMRVSFDFLVSGFKIGCSISRESLTFSTFDALPPQSSLPSGQSIIVSIVCACLSYVFFRQWRASRWNGVPYSVPIPEQAQPGWKGQTMANPSIKSTDDYLIQCYAPATGASLGTVAPAYPEDIDIAINAAAAAQEKWAKTSFDQRRKFLRTLLKYILENQDYIAAVACLDSGKTKVDAAFGEILVTVEKIKWVLKHGEKSLIPEQRESSWPLQCYKKVELRYEPLGVVAACVSWNYPFHNLLGPIISSTFAGNGIVVKGSEQTAWSSQYFISIVRGALSACGHNPDLVQSIMCWPEVAPHLTSHPGIAHMTFIGSRPVAHHVAASASKVLIPLCIELGGKDAAIILDDTPNLESVASILMRGVFQSCGQNCVGVERIIATPKAYPKLVSILEPRIAKLRLGSILDDDNVVDCGAVISDAHFGRFEDLVADAVKQGARCLVGGKRYIHPKYPKGHYFQPTLVVDVTPSMAIAQQEVFGPICLLMQASDVSDAISIANSTEYALGGSVFGRNQKHLDQVTREMKCGMVSVNDFAVYYLNQSLPFGGVKGSGYGRFAGAEGLRGVCNLKAVAVDRFPRIVGTSIPPVVDYPLKDGQRAWRFTKGLVELGYGETVMRKVNGLGKLMGM
ncbi:Aldehyde/histidinol dehydrogenase [Sphaerosporella brunnea]|uniref:aldehyde dehydrogenase (NAD(+)) n=1 Tax=Sphaerosporella brunnea TaxID=1250544 RepID=A0A5J5EW81_9PEZI|nr:Aldehyde/histidinol dehydrogenase [Sphaerosporella brunnea]